MHIVDPNTDALNRGRAVRDRMDRLIMGAGASARYRVLRLLDPVEAGAYRDRFYAAANAEARKTLAEWDAADPEGALEARERGREVRARIARLLGEEVPAEKAA